VTRKLTAAVGLAAALLVLCPPSFAAGRPGAIKGRSSTARGGPDRALPLRDLPLPDRRRQLHHRKRRPVRLPRLPPGTYKVVVEMPGFKTVVMDNVAVVSGRR